MNCATQQDQTSILSHFRLTWSVLGENLMSVDSAANVVVLGILDRE